MRSSSVSHKDYGLVKLVNCL